MLSKKPSRQSSRNYPNFKTRAAIFAYPKTIYFNRELNVIKRSNAIYYQAGLLAQKPRLNNTQNFPLSLKWLSSHELNVSNCNLSYLVMLQAIRMAAHEIRRLRLPMVAPGEMFKRVTFGFSPFTRNSFRGLEKSCYLRICMKNMKYE